MNRFIKHLTFAIAIIIPSISMAEPYCAALTEQDQLPQKYQKRGPFYSDQSSGWIVGQDQLKSDFSVSDETIALWQDIVAEFKARDISLVALIAPPRPLFAPPKAREALNLPDSFVAEKTQAEFAQYIAALNRAGISAPDLSVLATQSVADGYYFKRDTHWTPKGAAISAALLQQVLSGDNTNAMMSTIKFSQVYEEKGSLSDVAEKTCGHRPEVETVVAADFAKAGDAADLLGENNNHKSVALVGTSFSDRYKRDAYRVADALAFAMDAPVENFSVSGGDLVGAMEAFIRNGRLDSGNHSTIVWEMPYTAPLTNESGLRQILGALKETSTQSETEIYAGDIENEWVQVKHPFTAHDYSGLKIETPDVAVGQMIVEIFDISGEKTRVKLVKSDRVKSEERSSTWTIALAALPAKEIARVKVKLNAQKTAYSARIRLIN